MAKKTTAKPKPKNKRGRPSRMTIIMQEKFLERIALGESIRDICERDQTMPSIRSLYRHMWKPENEDFRQRYEKALERKADHFVQLQVDIANDDSEDLIETPIVKGGDIIGYDIKANTARLARDKLKIETLDKAIARFNGGKYGDQRHHHHTHAHRHDHTVEGEITVAPDYRQLSRAILQVLGKAEQQPLTIEEKPDDKS